MEKAVTVTSILIVLLATTAFQDLVVVEGEKQDVSFVIQMTVTFSNPSNGTKTWNLTAEDRTISLFMNNTWQTVQLINHSYTIEKTTVDEDGNPIAILQFPRTELEPGENVSYTVAYRALSKPRSLPNIVEEESLAVENISAVLKDRYTGTEGPWLVNNTELQDLAQNITESETKVLTIVKKFIAWIKDNIVYETHEVPLYPNQTYAERKGDCDDQAILFITLCRIYGIPSYLQIGCIHLPTTQTNETYWEGHVTIVQKQVGWHGWATVYVPPWGWLPVDFTYAVGGYGDPLNAIKTAAVTLQGVVQYMDVTQTDYVASSRMYRDFLQNNDFYIYEQDEMIKDMEQGNLFEQIIERWLQLALVATVVATIAVVGFFLHIRKTEKRKLKEANQHGEELRSIR